MPTISPLAEQMPGSGETLTLGLVGSADEIPPLRGECSLSPCTPPLGAYPWVPFASRFLSTTVADKLGIAAQGHLHTLPPFGVPRAGSCQVQAFHSHGDLVFDHSVPIFRNKLLSKADSEGTWSLVLSH